MPAVHQNKQLRLLELLPSSTLRTIRWSLNERGRLRFCEATLKPTVVEVKVSFCEISKEVTGTSHIHIIQLSYT